MDRVRSDAARRRRLAAALLLATALGIAPLFGQQPETRPPAPTFRLEVNSVEVDVTVTDRDGRFVRDLTAADFEVLEDGRPQNVSAFGLVDVPINVTLARAPLEGRRVEVEPDIRSNASVADARVYVIVLDDLHVDALRSARVREVARTFVERYFAPGDLAAVVYTSGRATAGQEFTTSRRLLVGAIDRFMGRKLKSSVLTRLERMQTEAEEPTITADQRLYRVPDPLEPERAERARTLLENLKRLGELVSSVRGRRKAVVFISEGVDYDFEGDTAQTASGISVFTSPSAPDVNLRMRETINAAVRGNATVYSIDPRGLSSTGDQAIEISSLPQNPHLGLWPTAFQDELRRQQDSLRVLAEQTGGTASVSSNDFRPIFERIVQDTSTYYVLAYTSTNERRDGRFRKIDVRVKRPGVQVRARKGYTAPTGRPSGPPELLSASVEPIAALREAISTPVPMPGLTIRAFTAPFRLGPETTVLVGIEVAGAGLKFQQKNGLYYDNLSVVVAAFDEKGVPQPGERHAVEMELKPATYEAVRTGGVRLFFRLKLPAGRYQVRAAAHETGAGATGSVHHDVEVPDYAKEVPGVSGIILTATRAGRTATARADEQLGAILPTPATARRRFGTDEELTTYIELYPDPKNPGVGADVLTSLVAPDGKVAFRATEQVSGETLRDAPIGYGWRLPIPLRGVAPGTYVLRMEVRWRGAERAEVREVILEVATGDY